MNIQEYLNSPFIKDQDDNRKIGNGESIFDKIINQENMKNEDIKILYENGTRINEKQYINSK